MEIRQKERFRKYWPIVFSVVFCSILIGSAFAVVSMWSAPTTVTISSSSPYIKVYYEGMEVTSISFGDLVPGSQVSIILWVANLHPNASFASINYVSTLINVTDKITDTWYGFPVNLGPGQSRSTVYMVTVASDCPLGTYSWTLYLYGPG